MVIYSDAFASTPPPTERRLLAALTTASTLNLVMSPFRGTISTGDIVTFCRLSTHLGVDLSQRPAAIASAWVSEGSRFRFSREVPCPAGHLALLQPDCRSPDRHPVYEDVDNAYGSVGGEPLAVGRKVVDPP